MRFPGRKELRQVKAHAHLVRMPGQAHWADRTALGVARPVLDPDRRWRGTTGSVRERGLPAGYDPARDILALPLSTN
jgi:hypothetical protein